MSTGGAAIQATCDPPRYPIAAMRRAGVTVFAWLPLVPAEILAIVARRADMRDKPWWWHAKRGDRIAEPLAPYGAPRGRFAPTEWRPQVAGLWPEALPEPIQRHIAHGPALGVERDGRGRVYVRAPDEELDPTRASDGWPYPGLVLGECQPPASAREAEARYLRAVRTRDARGVVEDDIVRRSRSTDIPAEMQRIWEKIAAAELRREAYLEGRFGALDASALRSAWSPSRRDLGDWDYALAWGRALSATERKLFELRAADPGYSWSDVGRRIGLRDPAERGRQARGIYEDAVPVLFKAAVR